MRCFHCKSPASHVEKKDSIYKVTFECGRVAFIGIWEEFVHDEHRMHPITPLTKACPSQPIVDGIAVDILIDLHYESLGIFDGLELVMKGKPVPITLMIDTGCQGVGEFDRVMEF